MPAILTSTGIIFDNSTVTDTELIRPGGLIICCFDPATFTPAGYLYCNGQAVSRTTYADLYAVIGATYGAGDGSTTFNVPDLRGEFVRGLDQTRGVDPGRSLASAQNSTNLSHGHNVSGVNVNHIHGGNTGWTSNNHSHWFTHTEISNDNRLGGGGRCNDGAFGANTGGINDNHSHGFTTGGESSGHNHGIGGSGGNEFRPRNISVSMFIKT